MKLKTVEKAHQRKVARQVESAMLARMTPNEVAVRIRLAGDGFLQSSEWKALRLLAAERYGCICAKCGREQTAKHRINFDHIKPRKIFPELALDIDNLQPLCGPCNKRKGNKHFTDYRRHPDCGVAPEQLEHLRACMS